MAILKKDIALFERDEKGELIPQKLPLGTKDNADEILATPLTRGELRKLHSGLDEKGDTTQDQDGIIIKGHCKEPAFTDEEIKSMKPVMANKIVTAILLASGLTDEGKLKGALKSQEDLLQKNLEQVQETTS